MARDVEGMSHYRRLRIPGATYFFTVKLAHRGGDLLVSHIDALRAVYAATHCEQPFQTDAIVVLPDHLHAVWTLPPGDADFSSRWRKIKARFSRSVGQTQRAVGARCANARRVCGNAGFGTMPFGMRRITTRMFRIVGPTR
ncbi:MAG: hypothetical protein AAFZ99_14920 [Pseudomonadota bacterium]